MDSMGAFLFSYPFPSHFQAPPLPLVGRGEGIYGESEREKQKGLSRIWNICITLF